MLARSHCPPAPSGRQIEGAFLDLWSAGRSLTIAGARRWMSEGRDLAAVSAGGGSHGDIPHGDSDALRRSPRPRAPIPRPPANRPVIARDRRARRVGRDGTPGLHPPGLHPPCLGDRPGRAGVATAPRGHRHGVGRDRMAGGARRRAFLRRHDGLARGVPHDGGRLGRGGPQRPARGDDGRLGPALLGHRRPGRSGPALRLPLRRGPPRGGGGLQEGLGRRRSGGHRRLPRLSALLSRVLPPGVGRRCHGRHDVAHGGGDRRRCPWDDDHRGHGPARGQHLVALDGRASRAPPAVPSRLSCHRRARHDVSSTSAARPGSPRRWSG